MAGRVEPFSAGGFADSGCLYGVRKIFPFNPYKCILKKNWDEPAGSRLEDENPDFPKVSTEEKSIRGNSLFFFRSLLPGGGKICYVHSLLTCHIPDVVARVHDPVTRAVGALSHGTGFDGQHDPVTINRPGREIHGFSRQFPCGLLHTKG